MKREARKQTYIQILIAVLLVWLFFFPEYIPTPENTYSETYLRVSRNLPSSFLGKHEYDDGTDNRADYEENKDHAFLSLYTATPLLHVTQNSVERVCVNDIFQHEEDGDTLNILVTLKEGLPATDNPDAMIVTKMRLHGPDDTAELSGYMPGSRHIELFTNEFHALSFLYKLRYLNPGDAILPCDPDKPLPAYERWRETLMKQKDGGIRDPHIRDF